MKIEFEWTVSAPDDRGYVEVRERLCGTDRTNVFGPMRQEIARSFCQARRSMIDRKIRSEYDAMKLFSPQPQGTLQ